MPDPDRLHRSGSSRSMGRELAPTTSSRSSRARSVVDRLAMPDTFTLVFRDPDRDDPGQGRARDRHQGQDLDDVDAATTTPRPLIDGEVTSIETEYDVARHARRRPRLRQVAPAGGRAARPRRSSNAKYSDIASTDRERGGPHAPTSTRPTGRSTTSSRSTSPTSTSCTGSRARSASTAASTARRSCSRSPSSRRPAPGEGDDRAPTTRPARVGRQPARLPGADERRRPGQQGRGPRLGPQGEGGGHRHGRRHRDQRRAADDARRTSASKVGGQTLVVVDHGVGDQQAADAARRRPRAEQIGSRGLRGDGRRRRDRRSSRPGVAVSVAGVDPALTGKWVISGSRHEFGDGHVPHLARVHRAPGPLDPRAGDAGRAAAVGDQHTTGSSSRIVTDNDDPDQLGPGARSSSRGSRRRGVVWARLAAPGAGKDYGVVWVPAGRRRGAGRVRARRHAASRSSSAACGTARTRSRSTTARTSTRARVTYCGFMSRTGHKISVLREPGASRRSSS